MGSRENVLELFEDDLSWKERSDEGIEKYRKGDAFISVTDKDGRPLEGVTLKAAQREHEFRFGANIFMLDELECEEKNEIYKKRFAELFNMATLPFYWDALEPEAGKPRYDRDSEKIYRRPPIDLCIEFCEANGIEPREHALAYDHFFPSWLANAAVEEVKATYEKRCREIAERYADKIPTIEVTNEMEWETGTTRFYDEPDFVEWCFKTARKYFKNNKLVINEWSGLCWNDKCRATDKYYAYIEANMLKGAPIDAIGLQYHMFFKKECEHKETRPYYDPKRLFKYMDHYARLDKPLQITEVTVPAYSEAPEDEEMQAKILEKLYTVWFSHPNVEQIIYWNLVDGYAAFAPQGDMTCGENVYFGGLLRFDMTPKPSYFMLKRLFGEVWHTDAEIITDKSGVASFRGFYGTYDIELVKDGKTYKKTVALSKNSDNKISISL